MERKWMTPREFTDWWYDVLGIKQPPPPPAPEDTYVIREHIHGGTWHVTITEPGEHLDLARRALTEVGE